MKRRQFIGLPLLVLFLTLTSTVLASNTWYVDGVNGSDANDCQTALTAGKTIGHAISLASSGDSIVVAAATYTENLTIGFSLNVIGSGANTTIIDGGGVSRVVSISSGSVTLAGLTLRHGRGGIFNNGTLLVTASTITENSITFICPANYHTCPVFGGGIYNSTGAKLTISNSTVAANTVLSSCVVKPCTAYAYGGAIYNAGTMVMTNSTLTQNTAQHPQGFGNAWGGGISNRGPATISNSTISGNNALVFNGANMGGNISNNGYPVDLQNTVVANSLAGNCNITPISNGYNLSSDNTCNFNGPGDLNNTDPKLGTFGYNGGPTQTVPLLSGSPAIDAGNPSGCTDAKGNLLKTDQRGMPRPDPGDTGGCDIGAYESQN